MKDWSFVLTPQFLAGTVVAGLLLNIVAAYAVHAIDHVRKALPASYRRARAEESARVEALTAAATSDNALYAALAAEASRLRLRQLLRFFIAFICIYTLVFLMAFGELKPGLGVTGLLLVVFLVAMAFIQYFQAIDVSSRVRRLETALSAAGRNRKLPILD